MNALGVGALLTLGCWYPGDEGHGGEPTCLSWRREIQRTRVEDFNSKALISESCWPGSGKGHWRLEANIGSDVSVHTEHTEVFGCSVDPPYDPTYLCQMSGRPIDQGSEVVESVEGRPEGTDPPAELLGHAHEGIGKQRFDLKILETGLLAVFYASGNWDLTFEIVNPAASSR